MLGIDIKQKRGIEMPRDPFDEFKKIEKLFRQMMNEGDMLMGGTGYSVSVKSVGDETKVDVRGDVSKEDIEKLKRKYPNAEISVHGRNIGDSGPVEVLEEDEEEPKFDRGEERAVEEVDEDEMDPQELALKRFKEKREKEK